MIKCIIKSITKNITQIINIVPTFLRIKLKNYFFLIPVDAETGLKSFQARLNIVSKD